MLPVLILAGGLATRLRPLTDKIPKSMLPIQNKPFIQLQLDLLAKSGIREVIICVGYKGQMIQDYVGNGEKFGLNVRYSFDGDSLVGTGGAIVRALPLLSEKFMVLYGDSYLPINYLEVIDKFKRSINESLMTVRLNYSDYEKSNVYFKSDKIIEYSKVKLDPKMQHIDYGLMGFHASVFKNLQVGNFLDLSEILEHLVKDDLVEGFEVKERFYEVGSLNGISELERYLEKNDLQ
jgi:MurNAc alpha-1-phosphate uridylyltransferase